MVLRRSHRDPGSVALSLDEKADKLGSRRPCYAFRTLPAAVKWTLSAFLAALILAACDGGTGTGTPAAAATGTGTNPPSATATSSGPNLLTAWCGLTIGEPQASVMAAMGPAHGNKAGNMSIPGYTSAEWDTGNDILLASFQNGKAVNLQAYAGAVGPNGATDISCPAFRH